MTFSNLILKFIEMDINNKDKKTVKIKKMKLNEIFFTFLDKIKLIKMNINSDKKSPYKPDLEKVNKPRKNNTNIKEKLIDKLKLINISLKFFS